MNTNNYKDFLKEFENNSQLKAYEHLILEKNKLMNLTGHDTHEGVWSHLFYDSYLPFRSLGENLNKLKILDIGSGAGFPGLVLKIMFPGLKLTIVEAQNKRCLFLKQVVSELGLEDVEIVHSRAEELANSSRELYDVVTARAVAKLPILTEISAPYLKMNGIAVYPKGSNGISELEDAKKSIATLGMVVEYLDREISDATNMTHTIIICKKTSKTDDIYPRNWSEIKNNPL